MKQWIVGLAVVLVAAGVQAADSGTYMKFDVGPNYMGDIEQDFTSLPFDRDLTMNIGVRGSVAEGIILNRFMAVEVEAAALWNELDESLDWLLQVPLVANLVFRYECKAGWTAFVGIGGGGAAVIANTSGFNEQDSDVDFVPTWQGTAGINYSFNDRMSVGVVYKYLGMANPKLELELLGIEQEFKLKDMHNHYGGVQLTYSF